MCMKHRYSIYSCLKENNRPVRYSAKSDDQSEITGLQTNKH
jgi:hypothetical protein